jgi:PAS domain S-box-containing protein
VTLCVAIALGYVLAFVPLYHSLGRISVAAAILPVMVLGNSFGSWCGLIAGAALIPVNASLLLLAGEPSVFSITGHYFWPTHFTFILVGVAIGHLRNGRLRLERALDEKERAEDALQVIVRATEQSPASVVVTDIDGNIEFVNPRFTQITGYAPEEVVGENPRILKSGHTPPEEYERLWKTITTGGSWRGEFLNKKKNGEPYWEAASISPAKDADGNITHFVGVKEDITDRKRSEEERERLVSELQSALARIKTLSGLLSMCSNCKKIKDDQGLWQHVETYVRRHSNAEFSHGFCPDCMNELYPDYPVEDG